jgi:plastocyanin
MKMDKQNLFAKILLVGLIAAVLLTACQVENSNLPAAVVTPGIGLNLTSDFCPSLAVTTKQQITWTNLDDHVHLIRIKSMEGEILFDSGDLQPNDTASFNIPQAGDYTYTCNKNDEAAGVINVEPQ